MTQPVPENAADTPPGSPTPQAQAVLEFWFGDALVLGWPSQNRQALWFGGGPALDADIGSRFGALVHEAVQGGLQAWERTPMERLALLLLLDQFTRNVFRGQARAFAGDARAQALTMDAMQQGWDVQLLPACKAFLYMPLMHAESLALQQLCVDRFRALRDGAAPALRETLRKSVDAAEQHQAIVAQFGRFPYRNVVLGRTSTPQELAFLHDGPRFGQ